jgi:hypothetical protein
MVATDRRDLRKRRSRPMTNRGRVRAGRSKGTLYGREKRVRSGSARGAAGQESRGDYFLNV